MDFFVLGGLEAHRDGEAVGLGSFRQRSLLALLLIHANTVVSTDRILDELWGDEVGAERQNALWVHVSNLRTALEPGRPARTEGTIVLTRPPGYVAAVEPRGLDAWRFEELLREGRQLIDTDPAAASVALGEGLALWRGHAYEDFAYEAFAQAEIARLEELRLEAVELRLDADLRRGLAAELVGELEGLVRVHPLRERLTARLMLALHRSGRTSEALRAYQRLRARLADEIGVDPSSELQDLERQIISGGGIVTMRTTATTAAPAHPVVRGYELRDKIDDGALGPAFRAYQPLVGREVTIRIVRPELADDPEFIRRFEADAGAAARLEHPHIVPVLDYWREPGAAYVITPLFRAGTLDDALRRAPLAEADAGRVVREISSALAFAHERGVVHGAVSPGSVLLGDDGGASLGDFALPAGASDAGAAPAVDPAFVSPERLAGGPVTARSDVYGLGRLLAAALEDAPDRLTEIIDRATAEDPEDRYASVAAFAAAVDDALAAPAEPEAARVLNPYKGLRAFGEADAPDFFGRERVVERLLNRIGEGGTRGRLVALVGPSGSGKSSVVRAGLVPALRAGALPGSADWFVTDMTPGARPFEALAGALARVSVDPDLDLLDRLEAGEAGIRHTIDRVLPDERAQLVLIIDQFEELFTQTPEDTARAFLDALAAAATQSPTRVRIVVTLRADFYDRPLAHRAFGDLVRRGTEVIVPLAAAELEQAVNAPAARVGVRFEPGVLPAIVTDVADRPGALPLLQFALTELFERRRGSVVEMAAYAEMGGVAGALVHRAETLYDELDDSARETVKQVLLRLVAIGDGPQQLARRRVLREELTALGPSVDRVLDRLARYRLLTFDADAASRSPTVEVAHEALLSEWARLRAWIEDAAVDLGQQRRLASRVDEWLAGGRDDAELLRGPQFERFAAWAAGTDLLLTPVEREYLDASEAAAAAEQSAGIEREHKERRLRQTARRRARLLIGAAALLAVVVGLASFAIIQRGEVEGLADDLAAGNEARRLAALSTAAALDHPELALLLALQSVQTSATAGIPAVSEAEDALHWALQSAQAPYPADEGSVQVRRGPRGLTGVYDVPLATLISLARDHVGRALTAVECRRYDIDPCPDERTGLASPSAAGESALPEEPAAPARSSVATDLAGTTITIGYFTEPDATTRAVHERFERETGIRVEHQLLTFAGPPLAPSGLPGLTQLGLTRTRPDIVATYSAFLRDVLASAPTVDLGTYLDESVARDLWGNALMDAATVDGRMVGLPYSVGLKGLVWYPKAAFAAAGYTIPSTWDELLALSARIVADGGTPWCMGLETHGFGAWPATDWVEALVLRLGGVELYDHWVAHDVGFTDSRIAQAATMFGQVAFGDGFLAGGSATAARASILDAYEPMLAEPPGCWLSHASSDLPSYLPADAVPGVDYDYFVLPSPGPDEAPMFGDATVLMALNDRPEVRTFLRDVMDPRLVSRWAASAGGPLFIPAHSGVGSQWCSSASAPPEANDVHVRLCEAVHQSVADGTFRLDASDAMPPEVGLAARGDDAGAFVQGMADYLRAGPGSLDEVLRTIDAAWPS